MRRLSKTQTKDIDAALRILKKQWMQITVKELKAELTSRGIVDTSGLLNSIRGNASTEPMVLMYKLYGQFVDMGVGRGRSATVNREAASVNRNYAIMQGKRGSRRAKRHKWYSRRMGKEQHRLTELLVNLYGQAGTDAIISAVPLRIELTF